MYLRSVEICRRDCNQIPGSRRRNRELEDQGLQKERKRKRESRFERKAGDQSLDVALLPPLSDPCKIWWRFGSRLMRHRAQLCCGRCGVPILPRRAKPHACKRFVIVTAEHGWPRANIMGRHRHLIMSFQSRYEVLITLAGPERCNT